MGFSSKKEQQRQHAYDVDMLQREQAFNSQQAQIAYNREREFYDYQFAKESEYNSPAAQMQRYQAAGLNPYLMSLDGGNTSVSASSSPAASASGSNTVDMVGSANSTLQALSNAASIAQGLANMNSNIDLQKSQELKNYADATKTAGVDTQETRANIAKIVQDTATSKASETNIAANTDLTKAQTKNVAEDTRRLAYMVDKFLPKQYDEISKNIENLASQIWQRQQVTPAEVAELRQNVLESISRMHLNESQKSYVDKQVDWFDRQAAMAMSISHQQFQQLMSNTSVLTARNAIVSDILNSNDVGGLFNSKDFRNNIYKLRALETLNPFPASQNIQDLFGIGESAGRTWNLFGGSKNKSQVLGFLK